MEKLFYCCGENELNLTFPKRKWYELIKWSRYITLTLNPINKEDRVPAILLNVYEGKETKRQITSELENNEYQALVLHILKSSPILFNEKRIYESLILFDGGNFNLFGDLLPLLCRNINKMTIVSKNPEYYEAYLEEILYETGLIVECVENLTSTAYLIESKSHTVHDYDKRHGNGRNLILHLGEEKIPIRMLPLESIFLDIGFGSKYEREIQIKRPDITYYSMAKFLDTTMKFRYNTLVKEGNINKYLKLNYNKNSVQTRKGCDHGRKEKYLNLRRFKKI